MQLQFHFWDHLSGTHFSVPLQLSNWGTIRVVQVRFRSFVFRRDSFGGW